MSPIVALVALVLFVVVVFASRSRRAKRPAIAVIDSPGWGVANFIGEGASKLIDSDVASLTPVLGPPLRAESDVPGCDVLFLYCHVDSVGAILGSARGLRELIRDSGATIVVVAIDNPAESYIAAGSRRPYGNANLVMTIDRGGTAFDSFFSRLFSAMKTGVSMPVAWVQLAPQGPGHHDANVPATIFACEAGQVAFGRTAM